MSAKFSKARRLGEVSLKEWLMCESDKRHIKLNTFRMQLDRGQEYWPQMRTVNKRVIWVLP